MSKKDTIYIDVEDDITTVINKATSASSQIVALVLPKRFATLQSSVNMKLLKKAVSEKKKRAVLITTEAGLLPLAAAAGVHVAKNLSTRPEVPSLDEADLDAEAYGEDPKVDPDASLGELASAPLKNSEESSPESDKESKTEADPEKKKIIERVKWPGKLKVPNFGRFRTKTILAVVALLIFIVGYIFAFRVLPSAVVAITAETSNLPTAFNFAASLNTEENNLESAVLAAEVKEIKKTVTQTYQATGERDVGKKASGIITVQNCFQSSELVVPAGTTFTDPDTEFSFDSDSDVTVPGAEFTDGGSTCEAGEAPVAVTANASGDDKNLSDRSYFVSGFDDTVTGFGSQMSGGTTEIVSVVTQEDFETARRALLDQSDDEVLIELTGEFGDDVVVLGETFDQNASRPKSDPAVNKRANEARISAEFTYSIVAVNRQAMTELLEQQQNERIESGDQSILDNGLDKAVIELIENDDGVYSLRLETDAIIGPAIDVQTLAQEISGLEFSAAKKVIEDKPGVRSVEIDFSPVWVFNAPSADKISITINIEDAAGVESDE